MSDHNGLITTLRDLGVIAYDSQVEACTHVLEEQAGIQCYPEETLGELLEAIAVNIEDGTLGDNCFSIPWDTPA